MMLKVSIPTDSGNVAIENGTLGSTIEKMLADLKPEAAYFTLADGMRTALVFFDLKEPAGMPMAVEGLFLGLGAEVEMTPAMTPDELRNGLSRLG